MRDGRDPLYTHFEQLKDTFGDANNHAANENGKSPSEFTTIRHTRTWAEVCSAGELTCVSPRPYA